MSTQVFLTNLMLILVRLGVLCDPALSAQLQTMMVRVECATSSRRTLRSSYVSPTKPCVVQALNS